MKSIDNLREYGARFNNSQDAWSGIGWEILEIADAIEREVADMVPLPVDADGVPIHVGDVVVNDDCKVPYRIGSMKVYDDGTWDVGECGMVPHLCHHYHAPTVEDVLTEFTAKLIERNELTNGGAQTIAEYAAKLRLAGEDE